MRFGTDNGRRDGRRRAAKVSFTSGRGFCRLRVRRVDRGVSNGTEFEFEFDEWSEPSQSVEQERFDGGFTKPTGSEHDSLERVSQTRGVDRGR